MESKDLIIIDNKEDRSIIDRMHKRFDSLQTAHSRFQILNFILNDLDQPTDAGKYFQSLRELYGRYQNLISSTYEYSKVSVELEIEQISKERMIEELSKQDINKFDRRLAEAQIKLFDIEINSKTLRLESIKKSANETIREMKIFLEAVEKLDKIIPDELRNEDGLPDKEKSEPDFWFSRQMVCEQMSQDPNRTPFSRILGLRPNEPVQLMKDYLDRFVIVSKEDAKLIEEQKQKLLSE